MLKNKVKKKYFWTPFDRKNNIKIILGTEILWEKIKNTLKIFRQIFFLYVSIGPPGYFAGLVHTLKVVAEG